MTNRKPQAQQKHIASGAGEVESIFLNGGDDDYVDDGVDSCIVGSGGEK